jgi:glycosyltransferase involved in cell wall biosynthesis
MLDVRNTTAHLRKLRVGCVLHHAALGGAGLAFLELLDGIPAASVDFRALLPKAGPMRDELRKRGVESVIVPYRWWMDRNTRRSKRVARTAWNLAAALPVAAVLRRWKVDVVYTNTLTPPSGAVAARLLRRPHVWHVHEVWGGEGGFTFDLGEMLSMRLVDCLSSLCVAVSETVASQLRGFISGDKVRVVFQSVSGAPPGGSGAARPPASFVALVVGALFPVKRQEDAVRALAVLARGGISADLWLVGEAYGDYAERLRALALVEGIQGRVRFLGFQCDPWPFLKAADAVLSCCANEPFGRTTVEAMLVAKPVVAARGGGNSELVQDGFNGLLYESGNFNDLARCIGFLAENPGERARLGANARGWAESRFSAPEYGQAMLDILESAAVKKA